jgi:hypothetical protein
MLRYAAMLKYAANKGCEQYANPYTLAHQFFTRPATGAADRCMCCEHCMLVLPCHFGDLPRAYVLPVSLQHPHAEV